MTQPPKQLPLKQPPSQKPPFLIGYRLALKDPAKVGMALRVALMVGTILFTINHGAALMHGEMNGARWLSALLTDCVPYAVSIHGQYVAQRRSHP